MNIAVYPGLIALVLDKKIVINVGDVGESLKIMNFSI